MKLRPLLKTLNFRLSALYLGLILMSFAALGATVYFLTAHILEQELKNNIQTGLVQLQNNYKAEGLQELVTEIGEKENINDWNAPDYALIDKSGTRIAGTLPSHIYRQGWQVFDGPPERDDPEEASVIYANASLLSNGDWLVVGEDGEFIDDFGETIAEAFSWGALLVIALGIPCSIILSRSFLKKIGSLTRSTQSIIDGDLSHRLAVSPSHDELDELAILINRMLDQIGALIDNVQQVSNDIAHDLRTPISRLRQRLDTAQSQALSAAEYRDHIELAKEEIDTILATFSALLRIAHIEAGSRRSGFKMVDLGVVLTNVVDAFLPVTEELGKILTVSVEGQTVLRGDQELLTQLIFNIVENAVQYTQARGRIDIFLKQENGKLALRVADNGPGIPVSAKEKVFQRFYRVEQSRSTPGNGLGLSIARAVADLHDARIILLDNNPGLLVRVEFAC